MKKYQVEQKTPEWLNLRRGKITGTRLKNIIGTKISRDKTLWDVLAERLSIDDLQDETPLERGLRLESKAREEYEKKTGYIVETVGLCESDTNSAMTYSPDGLILLDNKYRRGIEIKCLTSSNHIKAWFENEVPKEYYPQVVQAFIVNEDLDVLDFVLYDPRVVSHPLHIIEVWRDDIKDDIEDYKKQEEMFLKEIEDRLEKIIKI